MVESGFGKECRYCVAIGTGLSDRIGIRCRYARTGWRLVGFLNDDISCFQKAIILFINDMKFTRFTT